MSFSHWKVDVKKGAAQQLPFFKTILGKSKCLFGTGIFFLNLLRHHWFHSAAPGPLWRLLASTPKGKWTRGARDRLGPGVDGA